ncbi:MAG: tetratricopeptide repeat protein [Synechococcales cyanobacterium CRU_2_2]|nr:tetratricopeptide repeat protein [Synechococcales cyanobacterium CRU_2_2]
MSKCISPLEQTPSGAQQLGNTWFRQGCFAEAIAQYDCALALKLDDADLWVRRGNALQGLALETRTLEIRTLETRTLETRILWNSAERIGAHPAVAGQRNFAEAVSDHLRAAIASYTTALQLRSGYPEAFVGRAMALYHLGRYAQALENYDAALGIRADYSEDWYGRGLVLHQLGQFEAAIASYDRALRLDPMASKAWVKRGVASQALGREAEALENYDRAAIAPTRPQPPRPHSSWCQPECSG